MATSIIMVKRPGSRGELGLFPDSAVAGEDLAKLRTGKSYLVTASSPRSLPQLRLMWALAGFIKDNTNQFFDKDEAMDYLKMKCRHCRMVYDPEIDRAVMVLRSLRGLDKQEFTLLINRAIWVICNIVIPGMDEDELRAAMKEQTYAYKFGSTSNRHDLHDDGVPDAVLVDEGGR